MVLKTLDPGIRRDDGKEINQRFPICYYERCGPVRDTSDYC
ncbi:MAG: hypothetical protein BMS9Abin06_0193 [Gammaproteobacteria bacterium]|nr:MAG: hypothetical protein BMS9Abin06_0193 [Gammaproteobacteria bacterium]